MAQLDRRREGVRDILFLWNDIVRFNQIECCLSFIAASGEEQNNLNLEINFFTKPILSKV